MEGSLYPNGVLIDRTALRRTETTKSSQILRMRTDITSRGVFSGGAVTVGVLNTDRVDISAFSGYTPRGDYISETLSNLNISLADYTLGTINVVCAVYTESNTHNQPHETDGTTYPTQAVASYRIRVFSQADFDNPAVLPSSDANLQNDALDRCLILAKVTAEGSGNPLTTISLPTEYNNVLWTDPQQLLTISGVTILDIDPSTPTGTGTITFDDTGAPPYSFYYTSPGGTISAVSTTSADSILTITDGSGYWIKIQVVISQLPLGLTVPYAETFAVNNLYYQEIPRLTSEDTLHRNFTGTGIVTPNNPHGQSLDDFEGQTLSLLDEHQDVMHDNGIWKGSSPNIFLGSINTVTVGGDTLTVIPPASMDLYYINGKKLQNMSPQTVIFDAANFGSGYLGSTVKEGSKYYEMYVDDEEVLIPHLRAAYPTSSRNCTGTWIVDMSPDHPAGSFDLTMNLSTTSNYINLQWGDSDGYLEGIATPTATGLTSQIVRLYHPNNVDWIDLYVGDDSGSGDQYLPTSTGTYVDTITVYASKDRTQNMQIMSFPYWYNSAGLRGAIGYPPYGGSRSLTDNRYWGTFGIDNMSDEALRHISYEPTGEFHRSGLLNRRHLGYRSKGILVIRSVDWDYMSLSGLSARLAGGVCYIRGKRLEVDGVDYTFTDNQTTLVWVDYAGTLHYDDFSATPYSSSLETAVEWIIGYPQDRDVAKTPSYVESGEITPQRGVPLYLVTAASGAITSYEFVGRYVGVPADDWTVGSAYDGAQFGSLKSAFAYAVLENKTAAGSTGAITIKIKGVFTLSETITQPSYVNVEGSWNSGAMVTVSPSSPDYNGSWRLSSGCKVSGVYVHSERGPVFGLAANVTLDRIKFTSSIIGEFVSLYSSAADVTISNCDITTVGGVFSVPLVTTGITFDNMRILDNNISSSAYTGNTALVYGFGFNNGIVRGNTITKDNGSGSIDPALEIHDSVGLSISENSVNIGQGDGTAVEKGIYVNDCSGVRVLNNGVTRSSGSTSTSGLGIHVRSSAGSVVSSNIISLMGVGIIVGSFGFESGYFENATVSDNIIGLCYYRGIWADADTAGNIANTVAGLRIENNQLSIFIKSAAADLVFGSSLGGISVEVSNTSVTDVHDISVCNNTVENMLNANSGNSFGISVYVAGSVASGGVIDSIDISGNFVNRIAAASGKVVRGIYFASSNGNYGSVVGEVANLHINNNNIGILSIFGSGTGSTSYGIQAVTYDAGGYNGYTRNCQIDNNNIYILTASPYTAVGDGISILNGTTHPWEYSSISNNLIKVPWYGIQSSMFYGKISGNVIESGSVGMHNPRLLSSKVSENFIWVESVNANRDVALNGSNYGIFGILVEYSYDAYVTDNIAFLNGDPTGNVLRRQSASIVLTGNISCSYVDRNYSRHYYGSTGSGDECFHILIETPGSTWSCSWNIINNDGSFTTRPSNSHGIYVEWSGVTSSSHKGLIKGNMVYGSNNIVTGDLRSELWIGTWGSTDPYPGNGVVMLHDNAFTITLYTSPTGGAAPTITPFVPILNYETNGANYLDQWVNPTTFTAIVF